MPGALDAARALGHRRSSAAPKRSASTNGSSSRGALSLVASSELAGALAEATVGPRLIAAESCAICGQPLARRSSAASAGSPGPAPSRPFRPSLRPGPRSRPGHWARAAAPCWSCGSPCRTDAASRRRGRDRRTPSGCADRPPARFPARLRPARACRRRAAPCPGAEARPTSAQSGRRRAGRQPARQAQVRQNRSAQSEARNASISLHYLRSA